MSLRRFGFFFLLVLLMTVVDYLYLERPATGIDDANIFFTYAQNLAHGQGFVFNPGGERVEGFTSFLWVLICALGYLITSSPEWILMGILAVYTSIALTMVYEEIRHDVDSLSRSLYRDYFVWLFLAFAICVGPSFIAWSVLSLMENGLWNMLFVAISVFLLRAYRSPRLSGANKTGIILSAVGLVLTRPEGLAWALFFLLLLSFIRWRNRNGWAFSLAYLLIVGATAAALTWFRVHYFGYPLPNTYYAKVSHDLVYNIKTGAEYAIRFAIAYHPMVTLMLAVMLAVSLTCPSAIRSFFRRREHEGVEEDFVLHRIMLVTLIIVACILLPMITGGDHFGGFRFYQNIILLFAWGLTAIHWLYQQAMVRKVQRQIRVLGLTLIFFFAMIGAGSMYAVKGTPKTQLNYEFFLARDGRRVAHTFNTLWDERKPSVGVVSAGGFALAYEGETVDLMGLNNTLMGHSKGDRTGIKNHAAFNKDVFYQLRPDVILPRTLAQEKDAILVYADVLDQFNFENQAMKHIFNDSAFQQLYTPVMIRKQKNTEAFFAFARKDFLQQLQGDTSIVAQEVKL